MGGALVRLAVSMLVVLAVVPAAAEAGTYDVYACRLPDGTAAPARGWTSFASTNDAPVGTTPFEVADRCAAGNGLSAKGAQFGTANAGVGWVFRAPADVVIAGFDIWRRLTGVQPLPGGSYDYVTSVRGWPPVSSAEDPYPPLHVAEERCPLPLAGIPTCPALDSPPDERYVRSGIAVGSLALGLHCNQYFVMQCYSGQPEGAELRILSARMTLRDDLAPALEGAPSGRLLSADPVAGVAGVELTASDRGAGVSGATLVVDDREIARSEALCAPPYVDPVPCPLTRAFSFSLDTTKMSEGAHQAAVLVTDAAGNEALLHRFDFRVANAVVAQAAPQPAASSLPVRLRAWFAGKSRARTRTVGFRSSPRAGGVLTDVTGIPLAGVALTVRDRSEQRTLTTDRRGRFAFRIAPGPSRVVEIAYGESVARVSVRTRAGVTLETSTRRVRNGTALKFTGQVLGERRGTRPLVTIYALRDGPRLRTPVETVRAGADGRFAYTYRFTQISGPTTFRFEARVPRQTGLPYLEGASPQVTVRGRP